MHKKTLWLVLLSSLVLSACSSQKPLWLNHSGTAGSAEAPLIDAALFFDENTISRPQLSSDGTRIAFIKTANDVPNIFVQKTSNPAAEPYQITFSKIAIGDFEWSQNGKEIFYLQDNNGDENYNLFKISVVEPNEQQAKAINLTNSPKARVAFFEKIKDDPTHIIIALNDRDPKFFDLYRLNTQSGKRVQIFENNAGFTGFLTNKIGSLRVAQRQSELGGTIIYGFDKTHPAGRELLRSAQNESMDILSLDETGNSVYFVSNVGDVDKSQLRLLDINTGQQHVIDEDPLNKSDFYGSLFSPKGELLLTSYYDGYRRDYVKSEKFENTYRELKSTLQEFEISILDINKDESTILLKAGNGKTPDGFYLYHAQEKQLRLFYQNNPELKPEYLADHISIEYPARDGETIQGYLTLPVGKEKRDLPLVVIPHGGPWARDYASFDSGYFNRIAQLIANRGYAVLQPNFRSSTGFGKRFFNLGHRTWGLGGMQHDITDGVEYLIELGVVDKERVAIFGGSYGGYAALAGATFTPDVYSAVVSFVGPSSLITLTESFPEYWRPLLVGTWFKWVGDPQNEADIVDLQRRSPLNYVDNIKAPILLVQGANDPRVKQHESEQIAKVMHEKGLPVEYILAKDEGHGFKKQANRLAIAIAVEHFLAQHLGGKKKDIEVAEIEAHLQALTQDVGKL